MFRPEFVEHDLGPLGVGVGAHTVERDRGRGERVQIETLGVHAPRRDRDDAGVGCGLQNRKQRGRQQERCDDVHLRGDLETIGGVAQIVRERARVVDQHVEPRYRPTDAVGEVPHVVEDREVRDRGRHAGIRCDGSDRAPGCFDALRVAPDDPDVGVALRERRRRGEAETAGRARDQRDPAAHVDNGLGIPIEQRTACRESDATEAADDRRFERGVGQPARTVEARHAGTAARRVRRPAAARSPMRRKTSASSGSASRPMPLASSCAS